MSHDEWYTPLSIIMPIRQWLGGIDVDLCSCYRANETVKARHIFTKNAQSFNPTGEPLKIWINPPYCKIAGDPNTGTEYWLQHCLDTHRECDELIALVNTSGGKWYSELATEYDALYQKQGRIAFIDGTQENRNQKTSAPRYDNDFLYLGYRPQQFSEFMVESFGNPRVSSFTKIK